ncbi:MAG TPA: glycosyltransferase [Bryobacteraceae bacterium]|nr:glycosyltransferase [Bryobacteraceae bacterium]
MAKDSEPNLSIVIPAWNERENLEVLLPALSKTLGPLDLNAEILVVDAAADEGTRNSVEGLGARYLVQQERGYGGALMTGFSASRSDYVATMDADLSHPPAYLKAFWENRDKAGLIIASRYVHGGRAEMGLSRYVLSRILNTTFSLLLGIPVKDMSSGFRMYRREQVLNLRLLSRDFDVLEEILVKIHHSGARILEVPFHYMPRGAGRSHAKLLKFGIAYLKLLVRARREAGLSAPAPDSV